MNKVFNITYTGSWNDNVAFTIEEVQSIPAFMKYEVKCDENEYIDQVYENEWKQHTIGAVKYSHSHTNVLDRRPPFSTINGNPIPAMDQLMPPCPWWIWIDDWHVDESIGTSDGWLYLDHWYSEQEGEEQTTKLRIRRWIRKRLFMKVRKYQCFEETLLNPLRTRKNC